MFKEPKYKIGDVVWAVNGNYITNELISSITHSCGENDNFYTFASNSKISNENELYSSFEDAKKSWEKQNIL